ncbi:MAG TPA: glutaminase, partial [Woeseiaceae bacterium]
MHNKVSNSVFHALDETGQGVVAIRDIIARLESAGFTGNDPRLTSLTEQLHRHGADSRGAINCAEFDDVMTAGQSLLERTVKEELVIPQFSKFASKIEEIFELTKENRSGEVASYIPQLARVAPDQFGVSICTIDGQRLS